MSPNDLSQTTAALQFVLPALLAKTYAGWKDESLDGFPLASARVEGRAGVALLGLAQLITTQEYVPAWVRIRAREDFVAFEELECRVGERGAGPLQLATLEPEDLGLALAQLCRREPFDWAYRAVWDYPTGFFYDWRTSAQGGS